jgi:hypothetical protein
MRRGWTGVLAAVAALALTGTARAEVLDDNPAAASRGPGQITVFLRASDGSLQVSDLSGDSFTPWQSLGGYLDSGPGAVGRTPQVTDAFVRGGDGALYQQTFLPEGRWSGWYRLGHTMLSSPTVSVRKGNGILDLFWRGADNSIQAKSWVPGSGWTDVSAVPGGGLTSSAPAAVSRNSNQVDVFVRGTDDNVFLNFYNGSAWSGWALLPGGMKTQDAPAAIVRSLNTLDAFVRSGNGEIRWITWDGAAWSGWKTIPGGVDSGPAVVSDNGSRVWMFARRGGDVVYNVYDNGRGPENGWDGWKQLHPPPPPPPPPPACDLAAGRVTAQAKLVSYGRRPRLSGRARRTDGAPLNAAFMSISPINGGWTKTTIAGPDGHYSLRIPPGPTRRLRVTALAPGAGALACTTARVRTRAGVTLKATKRVRPGGRVRFTGRLRGLPVPGRGKLVELQAFDGGRWRTFAQPRSRKDGRYRSVYRLRRTFGPRTFRFRARVRKENGYPYELGFSRRVKVSVR